MRRRLHWAATAIMLTTMLPTGIQAAAPEPTCTITRFELTAVDQGTALDMAGTTQECMGSYPFLGVFPKALGAAAVTVGNFAELAALLRRWRPMDGVPAVAAWVNLAPAMSRGMTRAGIDPVRFLQWVNEHDGGAPWPPWLPKPSPLDPAVVPQLGTIPGALTPLQMVSHVASAPPSKVVGASLAPAVDGSRKTAPPWAVGRRAGAMVSTASAPAPSPAAGARLPALRAPRRGAARPAPAVTDLAPPQVVTVHGRATPCAVIPSCRSQVQDYARFLALPLWGRLRFQVRHLRFPLRVAVLGGFAAALLLVAGRRWRTARRRASWEPGRSMWRQEAAPPARKWWR